MTRPLLLAVSVACAAMSARAQDTDNTTGIATYFERWNERVDAARASQPGWSSPLITTTALLEERVRFDASFQRAGNATSTTAIDGGKGLDLIVSDANEVQIAGDPYIIRRPDNRRGNLDGFNDWPVLRLKHRFASSPSDQGDYVLSAWLQFQFPTGIAKLTNNAITLLPTIGGGKGWGDFDVQATLGGVLPTAYEDRVGSQVVGNVALQYRLFRVLWPQIEANWTYYADGPRGGKNQVFLTPGIVAGRFAIAGRLSGTLGFGYQFAVSPSYRASPLLPAYDHAWLVTSRLSF